MQTGFLTLDELLPIFDNLVRKEEELAHLSAAEQLRAADDNRDGKLSLKEMISHWDVFYGILAQEHYENEEGGHTDDFKR